MCDDADRREVMEMRARVSLFFHFLFFLLMLSSVVSGVQGLEVKVLQPNGGEVFGVGEIVDVMAHASSNVTIINVSFEYSGDAGATWEFIGNGTLIEGDNKNGTWRVIWNTSGLTPSIEYLVKATATDKNGSVASDTSDETFVIAEVIDSILIGGADCISTLSAESVEIPTEVKKISEIFITKEDTKMNISLLRIDIPTEAKYLDDMFIAKVDTKTNTSLSRVNIPTEAKYLDSMFIAKEDTKTNISLLEVNIPTEAKYLDDLFIAKADDITNLSVEYGFRPVAIFTFTPEEPMIGETVTFNASDSYCIVGNIIKYKWDFGDGSSGEGIIVNHTYKYAGKYTVKLTVTDEKGLKDTCSKILNVGRPLPTINITTDKLNYTANDAMYINITIKNPGDVLTAYFVWEYSLKDKGVNGTIMTRKIVLPKGFNRTFIVSWKLPEFGFSFNASWVVSLYDIRKQLLSQDSADWRYEVRGKSKAEDIENLNIFPKFHPLL